MSTEDTIHYDYTEWAEEQKQDRLAEIQDEIVEIQDKIVELKEFVARRKAENKQKAKLMKEIEEVKRQLRVLGADDIADGTSVQTSKRKRGGHRGWNRGSGNGVNKRKAAGQKSKIVRLPVTVPEEAVDERFVDERFVDEEIMEE
jgi:hypothetical protein